MLIGIFEKYFQAFYISPELYFRFYALFRPRRGGSWRHPKMP